MIVLKFVLILKHGLQLEHRRDVSHFELSFRMLDNLKIFLNKPQLGLKIIKVYKYTYLRED